MLEGFITAKEAAVMLNRTSDYIRKLCANGEFEGAYKFGATWIIPKSAVENFSPKPRGFALFWEKYHAEQKEKQQKLKDEINSAIKNVTQEGEIYDK